jgi:hypothetical protein
MDEIKPLEDVDNLSYAFNFLKDNTREILEELCFQLDVKTPYEFVFKNMDGTPYYNSDVVITPGNPPTIIIVDAFVIECIAGRKRALYYKDRLRRAVEHLPRMHRTLSNLVPLSKAIELRRDAKRWSRALAPELTDRINSADIEIVYSVTVKDKITGTSITLSGDNPYELKEQAIRRVSKMVYEKEDFEELHDFIKGLRLAKSKPKEVQSVSVGGAEGETRLKFE